FDNGASIMHARTGELVWSKWMETEQVRQVAKIIAPVSRWIEYEPEHNEHAIADNEIERIDKLARPTSHVYGLVKIDMVEQTVERLAKIPDISFYTAASTKGDTDYVGIQVNHIQADKFHGVQALRKIVGIPKEYTLAIGDGDNDISLF